MQNKTKQKVIFKAFKIYANVVNFSEDCYAQLQIIVIHSFPFFKNLKDKKFLTVYNRREKRGRGGFAAVAEKDRIRILVEPPLIGLNYTLYHPPPSSQPRQQICSTLIPPSCLSEGHICTQLKWTTTMYIVYNLLFGENKFLMEFFYGIFFFMEFFFRSPNRKKNCRMFFIDIFYWVFMIQCITILQ